MDRHGRVADQVEPGRGNVEVRLGHHPVAGSDQRRRGELAQITAVSRQHQPGVGVLDDHRVVLLGVEVHEVEAPGLARAQVVLSLDREEPVGAIGRIGELHHPARIASRKLGAVCLELCKTHVDITVVEQRGEPQIAHLHCRAERHIHVAYRVHVGMVHDRLPFNPVQGALDQEPVDHARFVIHHQPDPVDPGLSFELEHEKSFRADVVAHVHCRDRISVVHLFDDPILEVVGHAAVSLRSHVYAVAQNAVSGQVRLCVGDPGYRHQSGIAGYDHVLRRAWRGDVADRRHRLVGAQGADPGQVDALDVVRVVPGINPDVGMGKSRYRPRLVDSQFLDAEVTATRRY